LGRHGELDVRGLLRGEGGAWKKGLLGTKLTFPICDEESVCSKKKKNRFKKLVRVELTSNGGVSLFR